MSAATPEPEYRRRGTAPGTRGPRARRRGSSSGFRLGRPVGAGSAQESAPLRAPRHVGASLDQLLGTLEMPTLDTLSVVFQRWSEIVGADIARHCKPLAIDGDRLILMVDDPMWASEMQWLSEELLRRLNEFSNERPLRSVTVKQRRG